MMQQAQDSSNFWAHRYGVGADIADEAVGRAALATLEAFSTAQQQQADGDDEQPLTDASDRAAGPGNLRAYVHRAAMTHVLLELAARTVTPRKGNDARARRRFDQRSNELAVELGRSLTQREQQELAEEIRRSYPENNRPHPDFHLDNRSRVVGYGTDSSEIDPVRADRHYGPSSPFTALPDDDEPPPGSARARAEEILAGGGRAAQLSAKSFAWSLVAERSGAPHPRPASISEYTAAKIRKSVGGAGGAVAVARAIRTGNPPPREVQEALFKPFGDDGELDEQQRGAVVDLITSHAGYGDDLWDAGVLASTNLIARKK